MRKNEENNIEEECLEEKRPELNICVRLLLTELEHRTSKGQIYIKVGFHRKEARRR